MKKFLVGLIIFIVIVVAMLVQINLLSVVTFFGVAANIGIVLTTGIGLMCGKEVGGIIGGIYGLLCDIVFGKAIGIYLGKENYNIFTAYDGEQALKVIQENEIHLVILAISALVSIITLFLLNSFILHISFNKSIINA